MGRQRGGPIALRTVLSAAARRGSGIRSRGVSCTAGSGTVRVSERPSRDRHSPPGSRRRTTSSRPVANGRGVGPPGCLGGQLGGHRCTPRPVGAGVPTDGRGRWAQRGSNPRPPRCKRGALPLSYTPRAISTLSVGPPAEKLSEPDAPGTARPGLVRSSAPVSARTKEEEALRRGRRARSERSERHQAPPPEMEVEPLASRVTSGSTGHNVLPRSVGHKPADELFLNWSRPLVSATRVDRSGLRRRRAAGAGARRGHAPRSWRCGPTSGSAPPCR